ncbi:MAG: endonuclease MutS2 [Firmicutes bacterium]|nr:endonuclease MutS2 [Bacillota bacterium]
MEQANYGSRAPGGIAEETLRVLEFDKVLQRLERLAATQMGKEAVRALRPQTSLEAAEQEQERTAQAVAVLQHKGAPPWGGITDIRGILRRVSLGSSAAPEELLQVRDCAYGLRRLRRFLLENAADASYLAQAADRMREFPGLETEISRCIDDSAQITDAASPELGRVRSALRAQHARLRSKLEEMLHSPQVGKYLQEPLVTVRQGRYVLPVKAEYRTQVPGVVHDQSASGATLFVEPLAVVDLHNQLVELQVREKDEEARVLTRLSRQVAGEAGNLEAALQEAGVLDLVFARAGLAEEQRANRPTLNTHGYIRLVQARHPLLPGQVVPIDVELGGAFQTLVITGPNTGGKTVTLKTLGLLALMAQAGMQIPAAAGSETAVFTWVFADIGDEQSIEQSLSTFSGHLRRIVAILQQAAGEGTLVLLDELGAGTDPAEGAALGIAILEELHGRHCRTVATTHYAELKAYAYTRPGVENASVEFDVQSLRPTYRLQMGLPGRSNAFAIASRLGMPAAVLDRARAAMASEDVRVEDLIRSIEEREKAARQAQREAEILRAQARRAQAQAEEALAAARRQAEQIVSQARRESERRLKETQAQMDELVHSLRQAEMERRRLADELRRQLVAAGSGFAGDGAAPAGRQAPLPLAGSGLAASEANHAGTEGQPAQAGVEEIIAAARRALSERRMEDARWRQGWEAGSPAAPAGATAKAVRPVSRPLQAGQAVRVRTLNQTGYLLGDPQDGEELLVQVGLLRLSVPRWQVEPVEETGADGELPGPLQGAAEPGKKGQASPSASAAGGYRDSGTATSRLQRSKSQSVRPEVDLRGLSSEEACDRVEKYLDDALLAGLPWVRVIHGKGTGALREAIRRLAASDPRVKSYRPGSIGEGGDGVTVMELG